MNGSPENGLMIAFAFTLPYHVMRAAADAGVKVHVLGHGVAEALRSSRHCASFSRLTCTAEPQNEGRILAEIDAVVRRHRIDVIFPSDDVSTRLLIAIRDRLPARSSLLPDLATFDLLNNKWNFTRYCRARGVRVPAAWCFETPGELRAAIRSGGISLPITVKPINRSGSVGVFHLLEEGDGALLDRIDYRPILVQRHIVGEPVCISTICRDGRIVAHAGQRRDERRFRLFSHPDLLHNAECLAAATGLTGPANFDAVIEAETDLAYIVECNPRFWYTIYLSMLFGLNFMRPALTEAAPGAAPETMVSDTLELSLRHTIRHYFRATPTDRALARYHLLDPVPYLLYRRGWVDDSDVAVDVAQMNAYAWREPEPEPAL
jgi:biotin carboxylase